MYICIHTCIHTHTYDERRKSRNYNLVLIVFHKAVFVLMTPFLFLPSHDFFFLTTSWLDFSQWSDQLLMYNRSCQNKIKPLYNVAHCGSQDIRCVLFIYFPSFNVYHLYYYPWLSRSIIRASVIALIFG